MPTLYVRDVPAELYERLPEVGDPDKPKFVFFLDEAHLIFNEAPRSLMESRPSGPTLTRSGRSRRATKASRPW